MLITLKEAARWAEENLKLKVTPATLRSACVDQRLPARQELRPEGSRRGQPLEWKVSQLELVIFLTGKYRPRKTRRPTEPELPVQLTQTRLPVLAPALKMNPVAPATTAAAAPPEPEPEPVPKPRYKVTELILQPTLVDFERHEVYDRRVIKKNIPKHTTAQKLAAQLAARALQDRLSHQLCYVVEEYYRLPRRQ
jgi:hypothetical protein